MICVTGANGFIGSNIVQQLDAAGAEEIIAVDSAPRSQNLAGLRIAEFVEKDELLNWLARRPPLHAILHMGACSDTTQTDREFMMRNNLAYTQALWTWCAREKCALVYASSAATYGDGSQGYDDRGDPRKLKPLNLYGESKQLFDLWALEQPCAPPRWAGLKFFNVYGPREAHKGRMASVAFHAFNQIHQRGQVALFKSYRAGIPDGGQKRDFVYVADAVAAVRFFMENERYGSGLYNVGTGVARTFEDLARAVFQAMEQRAEIAYIPMPEDLRGKYQYFTQASTEKLRGAGFTHSFRSLEEGVSLYVRSLRV